MSNWPAAYDQHAAGILGYLHRRLRRREEAEDLCQETFARAMAADGRLRDPSRLRSYLYRIARNLLLNHLRRQSRLRLENDYEDDAGPIDSAAASDLDPQEELQQRELEERLTAILARLPDDQRRAFELGVLERRPYAQIASMTGWSQSKVKISIFRARKRIIDDLGEAGVIERES